MAHPARTRRGRTIRLLPLSLLVFFACMQGSSSTILRRLHLDAARDGEGGTVADALGSEADGIFLKLNVRPIFK